MIPVTEREPLVITMVSAFTDGVRNKIRKAQKTMTILGIEFPLEHYRFDGVEQGCQQYETREETVNVNAEKGTSITCKGFGDVRSVGGSR